MPDVLDVRLEGGRKEGREGGLDGIAMFRVDYSVLQCCM